ncbi:MFS transporter [Pontibacillus litoralis]|uniref:Major facilitator superfamily (MFS) profile domain-containing protein n=1 Tax=Pontibacillus litoralis JSM 072002 TaxID=1385512 RepID=A0A0A5FWP0_9BACI|nr:MFS transporter [Pontibacillus litoralis]KGX85211.1 hypothetical protein N784_09955 [Pontibacillus litoralis JSM 072002]
MKGEKSFKKFIFLWGTQSISEIGSAVTLFSLIIWLTQHFNDPSEKHDLAFSLAAINISFALVYILLQPYAGVVVDKYNRRSIMMMSNYVSSLLTIGLLILLTSGQVNILLLVIYNSSIAACRAFHMSAFSSSFSLIVPEKHLSRANGMTQASFNSSEVLGPILASFLIAVPGLLGATKYLDLFSDGIPFAILVDAISFLIGAFALHFISFPYLKPNTAKTSLIKNFREGIKFINKPLYLLLSIIALSNLIIPTLITLQPLLVKYHLTDVWSKGELSYDSVLATLNSINALGGVVGGIVVTLWGGMRSKKIYGVVFPMIVVGVLQIFYGLSPFLYLTAAIGFLIFFADTILATHSHTIWQTVTPDHLQGRVFAVRRMLAQVTWPLSGFLAGWIGGVFNISHAIVCMGVLSAVVGLIYLGNKTLLSVEDTPITDYIKAN